MGDTHELTASFAKYKGVLDEVRIWNLVRSDADIGEFYNRVLEGNEDGLLAYWRFEEPEGEADLILDTDAHSAEESARQLLEFAQEHAKVAAG